MVHAVVQTIHRDPQLFVWILLPILTVMILTGVLRHYVTVLITSAPKKVELPALKEQKALQRGVNFRMNANAISESSFKARKNYLVSAYQSGEFLKPKQGDDASGPSNPMTDPAMMDGLMGMMKGNMSMIIPQTIIMGWINAFFSGFVVLKLPFAITPKFKQMLQSGVMTSDLDARWVSSISLYFICLFGLQAVFNYLLGSDNAASQMAQQQMGTGPAVGAPMGPQPDFNKLFLAEAENIEVMSHQYALDGVEERLLASVRC